MRIKELYPFVIATVVCSCGGNNAKTESDATSVDEGSNTEVVENAVAEGWDDDDESSEEDESFPPTISYSEDGKVKVISARYQTMGTMGQYWSRWKFKNSDGKICEAFFEDGSLIKSVHAINKLDGSTYYIANCFGNASSTDGYKWLEAYKIVGDTIEQVRVVDGQGKVNTSDSEDESFAIEFYIPNDYYVHDGSSYKWTFEYDPQTKDFYIPLFTGGDFFESEATDRYNVWHFNGKCFIEKGESPNRDLNIELANYNRLVKFFKTKDYIVRVDSLNSDAGLRYACWKRPKTTKDKPDIVLNSGRRTVYNVADDQIKPSDDFRFKNGDYQYIVNYCEISPEGDGVASHKNYLVIYKDDEMILKQEEETNK